MRTKRSEDNTKDIPIQLIQPTQPAQLIYTENA